MRNTVICLWLFCLFSLNVLGQSEKSKILAKTKTEELKLLAARNYAKFITDSIAAHQAAKENNWPTENLYKLDDNGLPIYLETTNNAAAGVLGTQNARTRLNSTGAGMTVGMWEAVETGRSSRPRINHQDFPDSVGASRISIIDADGNNIISNHATHVAGTLIGDPPSSAGNNSRGMAYSAELRSFGASGDATDMATEGAAGMLISNHSYGTVDGWSYDQTITVVTDPGLPPFIPPTTAQVDQYTWNGGTPGYTGGGDDPSFGAYSNTSRTFDQIAYNAPYYLSVWSAGNDDNDNPYVGGGANDPPDQVRNGNAGGYNDYSTANHPNGDGAQPCNTANAQVALNTLVVGALNEAGNDIASFSSRGITDDNRIALDICGIGVNVWSALGTNNSAYGNNQGTSMAAPTVAGSLLILQDGYEKLHGNQGDYMLAATVKALAIHTATDLGATGPDGTFGWGRLNAENASEVIEDEAWKTASSEHKIIEDVFTGSAKSYLINTTSAEKLLVTLCYTDPINPNNLTPLQNDLDLRVTLPSSTVLFPQQVGGTTGDDDNDVVERVQLFSNQNGITTITVSLEGSLYQGQPQPFSLIISGLDPTCHYDIEQPDGITIQSGNYTSKTSIESAADLDTGAQVVFQRANEVRLKPGFHAKSGTRFETIKGTCN